MTKFEFIAELRARLVALTNEEREAAVKYYDEFFDDAGPENEQEVIKTLVSPQKVAEQIIEDYNKTETSSTEYIPSDPSRPISNNQQTQNNTQYTANTGTIETKKQMSGGAKALLIVLVIIFFPAIIGILGALFGILIGIGATIFGLWIAFASVVLALIFAGIACVIGGIGATFADPIIGLGCIGVGLIIGGIGIFLLIPFLWITTKAIPAIFKCIVNLISMPFHKNTVNA